MELKNFPQTPVWEGGEGENPEIFKNHHFKRLIGDYEDQQKI